MRWTPWPSAVEAGRCVRRPLTKKQLEKLKVHKKRDDGLNIWACQVRGPRKKTILKGYLIEEPALIFELIPPDNPFLVLDGE
ncbi:DNA-binding domain-containing protein [Pseudomonas sp. R5(2019)]|nr:DNA-binding domain-containing protein [Pseudomonas sp. R5(2019)]